MQRLPGIGSVFSASIERKLSLILSYSGFISAAWSIPFQCNAMWSSNTPPHQDGKLCFIALVMTWPNSLCVGYLSRLTRTFSVLSCQWCRCSRSGQWRVLGGPSTLKILKRHHRRTLFHSGVRSRAQADLGPSCLLVKLVSLECIAGCFLLLTLEERSKRAKLNKDACRCPYVHGACVMLCTQQKLW